MNLEHSKPIVGKEVFLAPNATLIGDVILGDSASVWYGAVVRGDRGTIRIGDGTSVLERAVLNTVTGPVSIGSLARVDPSAVLSAAELEDECIVGAGSVLSNARVGKHAILSPGSTLTGAQVPTGELWAGAPAVFVRKLSAEEISKLVADAEAYVNLAKAHAHENGKTHDQIEAEKLREELLRDRSEDYHSHLGITGQEDSFIETQARIVEEERRVQAAAGGK